MTSAAPDSTRDGVAAVCVSCRFGSGPRRDCTLIRTGAVRELIEQGPCDAGGRLVAAIRRRIAAHFPMAMSHADDAAQEGLLEWLAMAAEFPGESLSRLPALDRWIERFAANRVIDHLRRVRVIARLRCGACVHFAIAPPPRCTLEFAGDPAEELRPNPWWGTKVERHSDPRALRPPCREFEWRKAATFDIFEHEGIDIAPTARDTGEPARVVVRALDRLAARSDRGLMEAATLQRHYFRRESLGDIAATAGVSERTVKRWLAEGRRDLLVILTSEMGVESLADLAV